MPVKSVLTLSNITKTYKAKGEALTVLHQANLKINAGETVAIIGQSGAGKSTLLHIAGLLDAPTEGTVTVVETPTENMKDAERATLRNQTFGFIYQHHHLLREFTALENVLMPARIAGKVTSEQKQRAEELLQSMKMEHRMHHMPSQLSGGERQRVAIARALMNKPKLLLADEPTGNLDPQTAQEVEALFTHLVEKENMALLMVTHNPTLAATCQRTYRMEEGHLVTA